MNTKDRWSQLSMQQKADLIKLYIESGITDIGSIKKDYNSFDDGGPVEPLYYDDTPIEPAVVKAFKSSEDYNRFLGEKGARAVRRGTNKAANVIGETLRYTPIIGDVMDGVEAYEEAKAGDYTKASVLAGLTLLPNAVEKPLKAIGKGIRNLRLYNKYTKDGERFRDAVEYAVDKYSKRADMINDSYGGNSRKRVINSANDLKSTAYNQPVSTDFRIQALFPRVGGYYNAKTDEIWLNRYRPELIKKAWDSPKSAIKLIKSTAAHEGTHLALNHLGDELTVRGTKYHVANKNHPLYDRVGYAFSDPDRVSSVWARNPEELVANMTKAGYHLNIDPRLNVRNWSDSHKNKLAKFLSRNHYFTPEDALFMAEELSDFGYKNGGALRKFEDGGKKEIKYPLDATTDNGEKYSDIIMQREHDAYNALLRNGYSIEDARRLSPILTAQSLYETGWRLSDKNNNYAGYLDSKGNKLKYDSAEGFWDSHLKNLSNRWSNWDTAQNVEDYYNIVNQTHLNLKSKEDYNRYKKDNPNTFIYSPTWENTDYKRRLLSTSARVQSYLDRLSMNKDFPLNNDIQPFIDKSLFPVEFLYK